MNVRREMPPIQLPLSDDVARRLFERVAAFEDEIQEGLNEIFTSLEQDALKVGAGVEWGCRRSADSFRGLGSTFSGM